MSDFHWYVDALTCFRNRLYATGWAFHARSPVREMGLILPDGTYEALPAYGLRSDDVASHYGEAARHCRFDVEVRVPSA